MKKSKLRKCSLDFLYNNASFFQKTAKKMNNE